MIWLPLLDPLREDFFIVFAALVERAKSGDAITKTKTWPEYDVAKAVNLSNIQFRT